MSQPHNSYCDFAAIVRCLSVASVAMSLFGCQPQMSEEPRYRTLGPSDFFSDGRASRNRPEHTVAREDTPPTESNLLSGMRGKKYAVEFPDAIAKRDPQELLVRGQQRFGISCTPCHGLLGYGDGMVEKRGFKTPPSFHGKRLREMAVGQMFETVSHGYGVMPSYAAQVLPEDRWAIIAYIRALQLSQNYPADDLPAEQLKKLPDVQIPETPQK